MKKLTLPVSLLILVAILLVACSPVANPTNPAQTPSASAPVVIQPSATIAPTATSLPDKVLIIGPAGAQQQSVQSVLAELAAPAGLSMETRPEAQPADLTSDVKVVVLLATPANLNELVTAAPQAQFVVFASADLPAAANLTVIRQRAEMQAFAAGFISVLLSTDYRGAGLLPADGPLGASLQEAFTNGGRYFCGVCAPGWPLGLMYPQVKSIPAGSDGAAWQSAAADLFDNQKAEVFYIAPDAARDEVFNYMQGKVQFDKTVILLGAQTPPDALLPQWAATVGFDSFAALRQVWPDVQAGKGGAQVDAPLTITNINKDLLGEGRQRLVMDMIDGIKAGKIYPFSVPLQ